MALNTFHKPVLSMLRQCDGREGVREEPVIEILPHVEIYIYNYILTIKVNQYKAGTCRLLKEKRKMSKLGILMIKCFTLQHEIEL